MISLYDGRVYLKDGSVVKAEGPDREGPDVSARQKTMAYGILRDHDHGDCGDVLHIRFDSLISHDITYVGIIQTAKASGLTEFPVPYVMTNCHNSLCAVGGTINEDDHVFGIPSYHVQKLFSNSRPQTMLKTSLSVDSAFATIPSSVESTD